MDNSSFCRNVHLDFHTFEGIPSVGDKFSKSEFQKALKRAKLQSITVFAKCNQGFCYYPTKVGIPHPALKLDLTSAMLEAAHEIGVRAPVYINAGLSEAEAKAHPEWLSYEKAPKSEGGDTDWVGFSLFCLNDGPYAEHLYALTEEICQRYKRLDGLFFDIALIGSTCYCESCLKGMAEMGLDYKNKDHARLYYKTKRLSFAKKCTDILHRYHPNATIFFNSGGAEIYRTEYHGISTHYEMEDLPTAWGGYDKLPLRAKFFSTLNKPYLGMTGKFHLDWGEFGGFKSPEALRYEVCSMALYGAGCSVGDHMHPSGLLEKQTYENIGYAYDYLEKIAPFCYGGEPTSALGLYLSKNIVDTIGMSKLLIENQLDFEIATNQNLSRFELVILPCGTAPTKELLDPLNDYINAGGKVLFFGDALLNDGEFKISAGVKYLSPPSADCDYIIDDNADLHNLPDAPLLSYHCGHTVMAEEGSSVLFKRILPYFSRTEGDCCSRRQMPYNCDSKPLPAAVINGNLLYCCHPLATGYDAFGSIYHKRYFTALLSALNYRPAFEIAGIGSCGRATMIKQTALCRYCLNLTYAAPVKRGEAEIIEDIPTLYDLKVTLRVAESVKRACLGVTGEELPFKKEKDGYLLTIPRLNCHTTVVFEY